METRDRIHSEIESVPDADLEELYQVIRHFVGTRARKPGVLSRLKEIKIAAPEDFSANLELYLSGEKSVVPDPDPR